MSKGCLPSYKGVRYNSLDELKKSVSNKDIAELYHADKSSGKETELTKAVESLLREQPDQAKETAGDKKADIPKAESEYANDTPDQLAEKYHEESQNPSILSEVEKAIKENPLSITRDSYLRFGDKANLTLSKAKAYFSKKGEKGFTADQIAQTINDTHFNGEEFVSPQDIIDFMDRFPNGHDSSSLPSSNPNLKAIREAYFDKTGRKDLNRGTAKKLVDAINLTDKGEVKVDIAELIDQENVTLDNINDFKKVFDFLYDSQEQSDNIFNRVKDYLENGQRAATKGKSEDGTQKGSGNDNKDGGLGGTTVEPGGGAKPTAGGDGNGESYEGRLKESNQSVKEKETEVAKLQAEFDKASKALKKNLTENQVGMFENKPQSLFNDQSSQDKIVRERKDALDKAKQDLLDAKAQLESVKDSKNQKEFSWDELLDQSEVAPVIDFLDGLKVKQSKTPFSKILPVIELYNAAIDIIKVAVKTGNTLRKAVKLAIDHLRDSGATEAQIKGFEADIKGKIGVDKELNKTIKQNIKEATDSRSKAKVVMDELSAIKKQMNDFGRGFKEGDKEGTKTQKEKDDAYDQLGKDIRDKLIQTVKTIRDLKLFNGKHISQNGMLGMVKNVLDAGNNPNKLGKAIDYITKRLEVMDYDNKLRQAKSDIDFLRRKYFKGNQITVSKFLSVDPSVVPAESFAEYTQAIADLKAHTDVKNPFEINNFDYIKDVTDKFITPSKDVKTPEEDTTVAMNVDMKKPTETFKEKVSKGLKDFHRKWISFRHGMDKVSYTLKEHMLGGINYETRRALNESNKLNDLLKKHPDIKIEDIDDALRGNTEAFGLFPIEVSDAIINMRRHIDGITQMMIDKGLVSETQKATLEVNLGEYLNRSYQIFNNKNWTLDNLPEPLYNKATQFLYNQYYPQYRIDNPTLTHEQLDLAVKNRVEAKIKEYFSKGENNFFNQKNDGSKDLSIMMERNEIPIELRKLFGEVKDPIYNYLNTIQKMATLAQSANFLQNVRENALGTLMFEKNDPNRPADTTHQIASDGSETLSPLSGLYMSKELAESFKQQHKQLDDVYNFYTTAIGYVKAGKTVGSIITHVKNVEGNFGFMLSNGHWPTKDFGSAVKLAFADFAGKSNDQVLKELEPLIKNNIIGTNVIVGEIRAILDPNKSTAQINERMFGRNKTFGEKVKSKLFWTGRKIGDAYQAEDDMFKIFAFRKDQIRYSDALYDKKVSDLTDKELKDLNEYVTEKVKNGYPSFDRVSDLARIGSKYIPLFGNFVGFQSESYRVSYNLGKLAFDEMRSDNPKLRKIGVQRLAGMSIYHSAKTALIYTLGNAGIGGLVGLLADNKDEKKNQKATRAFLPSFSRNSDVIAFDFDKNKGTYQYVDVSSYDPFGSQMKIFNVVANGGKFTDVLANTAMATIEPFVGTEITANMLLNLHDNKDNYGKSIFNSEDDARFQAKDIAAFAYKVVEPGTLFWLRRIATKGDAEGEVKALFYRTFKVNVPLQFSFQMNDYRSRLSTINDIYKKEYYAKESTSESRAITYQRANQKAKDLIIEMKQQYKLALENVNDKGIIDKVLVDMKVPKKLRQNIQYDFINNYDITDKENIIPKSRQPEN